jgi:hypothetical protein
MRSPDSLDLFLQFAQRRIGLVELRPEVLTSTTGTSLCVSLLLTVLTTLLLSVLILLSTILLATGIRVSGILSGCSIVLLSIRVPTSCLSDYAVGRWVSWLRGGFIPALLVMQRNV